MFVEKGIEAHVKIAYQLDFQLEFLWPKLDDMYNISDLKKFEIESFLEIENVDRCLMFRKKAILWYTDSLQKI